MPTAITSELSRGTTGTSPFPLLREENARISHLTVDTIAERDAIPEWKRRAKMTCYVVETDTEYRLGLNITIAGQVWTARTFGVPDDVLQEDDILDGNGFIKPELIQNIFLNDSYIVDTEAEMLALTTVTGNFLIRTDTGQVYVKLNNDDPAAIDDFAELTYPGAITSVNGQTGPTVTITLEQLITANPSQFEDAIDANATILDIQTAIGELQANFGSIDLSNKADLVSGTVPLAQLPYTFGSGLNLTGAVVALNGDITETVELNAGNTFDFTLENVPNLTFAATSSISLAYVDGVNDFELFVDGLAGFRYDQDLSGGFTDNSLITKLYADNRIMGQALGDPNDDRIVFWDDSAGGIRYLDLGSGLSITGTVLSASGGGGGGTWGSIIGTVTDQTDLVAYITDQIGSQSIVVVPGTTYTFSASDSGKVVIFTSGTGCTANFPAGLPSDFFVDAYVADNAGTINFTVDISYTLESDATALTEKQAASFFFRTATILVGIMGTAGGSGYSDEQVRDVTAAFIQNGTGISWSHNDLLDTLTPTVSLAPFSTTNLAEGSNLYFTDERVDDRVAALIQNGTGITWSYNDVSNTLTPTVTITQYTDELAQDAIGAALTDSDTIDFSYNDVSNTITAVVIDESITFAKLQNIPTETLIGRNAVGTGDASAIGVGKGLFFDSLTGELCIGTSEFNSDNVGDSDIGFTANVHVYTLHVGEIYEAFPEPSINVLARFSRIQNFEGDRFAIILPSSSGNAEEMETDPDITPIEGMFCFGLLNNDDTEKGLLYYTGTEWRKAAPFLGGEQILRFIAIEYTELNSDVTGINFSNGFTGINDTVNSTNDAITVKLGGYIYEDVTWTNDGAPTEYGFIFGTDLSALGKFTVAIDASAGLGTGSIHLEEVSTGSYIEITDELLLLHADGALGPYDILSVDTTSGQVTMDFSAMFFPGGIIEDDTVTRILALSSIDRLVYIDIADIGGGGGGGTLPAVDSLTTGSTVTTSGIERVYLGDTTGGTFTTVLPTAVGNEGYKFIFKKIAGSADWIIDADGTELIDGALTLTLSSLMVSVTLISDGANWYLI